MKTPKAKRWNEKAEAYSKMSSSKVEDGLEYLVNFPSIVSLCPKSAKFVLDLGSGCGNFTEILSKKFEKVEGVDVSPNMVKIANANFPNITFFIQNLEAPFAGIKNNTYDLIICKLVLMYIENLQNVAEESYRILKPGGHLIISVSHPIYWTNKYLEHKFKVKEKPELAVLKNGYFTEVPITKNIGDSEDLVFDFIHRKFETYVNTFTKVGFVVDKISEPALTDAFIEKNGSEKSDIPMRLNIRFVKTLQFSG